ncbi:TlpA family protein disulfide reductase [Pedobacter steynii]|uniref:Thioredoxin n=1 Tax=Pedobacter steynii TaxID=430522 RepID=A0A1D7QD89_9SPHI|nr:TlpA disulfide reductase family protein [Pedobacter steynii]AOM76564.1 thioredoxin [Pedobacter steynii]
MRKMFKKSNVVNGLFVILILIVLFVPSAKGFMLQGLMGIGLFKPDMTEKPDIKVPVDGLSGILFKNSSGKEIDLGDLKGKVVFLNFWATWCPPCLAEMPSVNKLFEQFKDDKEVVFILVDADNDFAKAQKYMDRKGYQLPVYTAASSIPDYLFSGSLPTTVVFDKEGRISYHESGAANYASARFIDFIKKLKEN